MSGDRIMVDFKEYDKPYIIAEIGANHNGDLDLAKKMITVAKECGADCVKFQSWSKDTIFSKKVYEDNYFLGDDYRDRTDYTLESIVDKYHIGVEQHVKLKEYCDLIGIDFNSTPFSKSEVDLLVDRLHVPFIKVASMDLNNIPMENGEVTFKESEIAESCIFHVRFIYIWELLPVESFKQCPKQLHPSIIKRLAFSSCYCTCR